jgi:hypothetical protein
VLIRPLYWWQTSWADDVRASIERYGPGATQPQPAITMNPGIDTERSADG